MARSASQPFKYSLTLGGGELPLRALGLGNGLATLTDFGISDALPNPYLELSLIDSDNAEEDRIAHNDDWEEDDRSTEVSETGLSSTSGSKEAALIRDLLPGEYSWQLGDINSSASGFFDFTLIDLGEGNRSLVLLSPDLLDIEDLAISENQPIGTIVGEFNSTDPVSNSTLTYSLVSGEGDANNGLLLSTPTAPLKRRILLITRIVLPVFPSAYKQRTSIMPV